MNGGAEILNLLEDRHGVRGDFNFVPVIVKTGRENFANLGILAIRNVRLNTSTAIPETPRRNLKTMDLRGKSCATFARASVSERVSERVSVSVWANAKACGRVPPKVWVKSWASAAEGVGEVVGEWAKVCQGVTVGVFERDQISEVKTLVVFVLRCISYSNFNHLQNLFKFLAQFERRNGAFRVRAFALGQGVTQLVLTAKQTGASLCVTRQAECVCACVRVKGRNAIGDHLGKRLGDACGALRALGGAWPWACLARRSNACTHEASPWQAPKGVRRLRVRFSSEVLKIFRWANGAVRSRSRAHRGAGATGGARAHPPAYQCIHIQPTGGMI